MTGPHSVIAVCTPQCHPLWDDQEPMWVTVKTDLASAEAKRGSRIVTAFSDKYATAPAIRRIGHDEVKPGMVVRAEDITDDGQHHSWTFRATEPVPVSALAAYDYIYLIKDDPREELAERLYMAFWSDSRHPRWAEPARTAWLGAADAAIAWAAEQRADS